MISLREIHDIAELMSWRREVIEHVFGQDADEMLLLANRRYYEQHMPEGSHLAVVAESDGRDCGCGAICLSDELPSPDNPSGKCAYLMNIYVRKPYRRHGIAHTIVSHLIEEAKRRGCGKIYLETTDDGRPVYESLGFHDMPGYMKYHNT